MKPNFLNEDKFYKILFFCLYLFFVVLISFYHEPWRDEFQDWAISQDKLYNIIFVIPHYDGHFPLWYLILKIFSFFKINPELGIKIPNLIFISASIWLLIFKSPFNNFVKFSLPFTYFLFYQYAVVSRPYSLFCFAFFLAATFFQDKNIHPFKLVLSLCLLSYSSAYGLMFAIGIIIYWFIEYSSNINLTNIAELFRDKNLSAFLFFLINCCFVFLICYTDKTGSIQPAGLYIQKLFNAIINIPSDALVTNGSYYDPLKSVRIINCIASVLIYASLFLCLRNIKNILLFLIPYIFFIVFSSFVYFTAHHLGLFIIFLVFIFWQVIFDTSIDHKSKFFKPVSIFLFAIFLTQFFWSICAYYNEFKYDYCYSRKVANYIKDNDLSGYKIMSYFSTITHNLQYAPVSIIPYFDRNIFYNFNVFNEGKKYTIWSVPSQSEKISYRKFIKNEGYPDLILTDLEMLALKIPNNMLENNYIQTLKTMNLAYLSIIFEVDKNELPNYDIVQIFKYSHIWKNSRFNYVIALFAKDFIIKNNR